MKSPDNASAFLPQQIIDGANYAGTKATDVNGPVMSSFIFTNNIKAGFFAFALGITFGIGTLWALLYNGFMLGSLGALLAQKGAALRFWSLILPHGILELSAIFICGAAGLIIGYSLINPGVYSRRDSIAIRGKIGIRLVCGTLPIFIIAGLIEGFLTPSTLPAYAKFLVAAATLLILACYLAMPLLRTAAK